jgi:sugar lactone lactonase YvrE
MDEAMCRAWLVPVLAMLVVCGCGGGSDPGPRQDAGPGSGIGPAGGQASEASGAQVTVPAGALSAATPIEVTRSSAGAPALPTNLVAFGPTFAFTPHGTSFAVPVTITVPFDPTSVPAGTTPKLFKTNAAQSGWQEVPGATVQGSTMTGQVSGFSFAVAAGGTDDPDQPFISAIDPDHARAGEIVKITGSGFIPDASVIDVELNNVHCTVREATATELTVEVPARAGSGNFKVFGPDQQPSQSAMFTYEVTAVQVGTMAGGQGGYVDDPDGTVARFMSVSGVAVDSASGTVFVADTGNHVIRVVSPAGSVGTLAGGIAGHKDGVGNGAEFMSPTGLSLDTDGNLYVADPGSPGGGGSYIRQIAPSGLVTTIVSSDDQSSIFFDVAALHGGLFATDIAQSAVWEIVPSAGSLNRIAGNGTAGDADGTGTDARFFFPEGVAICGPLGDRFFDQVFVADSDNMKIKMVTTDGVNGTTTTYTGGGSGVTFQDGSLAEARFQFPDAVACDQFGKLFVVDFGNRRIRMITPSGVVTTLAGSLPTSVTDGDQTTARFGAPLSIAVDRDGVLYIGDGTRLRFLSWF